MQSIEVELKQAIQNAVKKDRASFICRQQVLTVLRTTKLTNICL